MKRIVTIHAAKTNLSRLIAQARAGEEVVKLVPVDAPKPTRKFGAMKGEAATTRAFFEPLPADELAAWERSR